MAFEEGMFVVMLVAFNVMKCAKTMLRHLNKNRSHTSLQAKHMQSVVHIFGNKRYVFRRDDLITSN